MDRNSVQTRNCRPGLRAGAQYRRRNTAETRLPGPRISASLRPGITPDLPCFPPCRGREASRRKSGPTDPKPPRCVIGCHVLSCFPCARGIFECPFRHDAVLSRGVLGYSSLFRCLSVFGIGPSSRPGFTPTGRLAAGPFLRAYPACAPAPGRPRLAPTRFVRLIARARRRTHLSRRLPPGLFCGPQSLLPSAEKPKGGPGSRLSPLSSYYTFLQVKPSGGKNMKIFLISCHKPNGARAGAMDEPRFGGRGDN